MGAFEAVEAIGATRVRAFVSAIIPQVSYPTSPTACSVLRGMSGTPRSSVTWARGGLGLILNEKLGWRVFQRRHDPGDVVTVFIIESVSRYCRKNWYRGRAENEQTD